ncbi:ankyrin repeat and fibronectin type-III domain-containing protein 1 [Narcine bancroftii]|uniref:ankyrin repeat and fibronectin type-III domain-containing protein 1 n=1 Tax=Narcine bancroftii TaxID=1343680 RepID=UPI003831C8F4
MQNLHLSNSSKGCGPASPNAAKRLYRNLSNKLKGSHSSFDEVCQSGKREQLRLSSLNLQCNEALFKAVEQQDLAGVQQLLRQHSLDELDLNSPNSEGLMPLDIAVMTNDVPMACSLLQAGAVESPHFMTLESRASHLTSLLEEARERVSELTSQVLGAEDNDSTDHQKQLTAWEWRYRLYKRMQTGFELARVPEAPTNVRLFVTSSTSLMVTFQEPLNVNSGVVTRYKVEWSSQEDFSGNCGEAIVEDHNSFRCTVPGLTTGQVYYMRVSAANMKGWGPHKATSPQFAIPSNWKEVEGRRPRLRGQVQLLENLLQEERARHHLHTVTENTKLQNPSRKQSVSRSLKHLFHSSTKFVKTLKRGVYIAAIFHHNDMVLVTTEEQIPIVEVDEAPSSSITQAFLWFSKLSCAWQEVDWLRQNLSVSVSSSTALQARHRMLTAAAQLQSLLGTQNLGRMYYEPIKDRHGNVLLVTVKELKGQTSPCGGRWIPLCKIQSQRKSLSTPEQPTALDILLITLQDVLSYQKRSEERLKPGLYLGYLKVSSSVEQIKVLVPSTVPNVLCHVKVRDNYNVSREEWEWLQSTSTGRQQDDPINCTKQKMPLLASELQTALRALLGYINIPLNQAEEFRVFTQEVLELGHNVCFLLLLPPCTSVCTAPGQRTAYPPHSRFLNVPLQMFELVHFCTYQDTFMNLYCRVSALLEMDSLISQQTLREAISDVELRSAKQRDCEVSQSLQQLDALWREMRWIMDALSYARYRHPSGSLLISWLITCLEEAPEKNNSLLCPSPRVEVDGWRPADGWQRSSKDKNGSEVFVPIESAWDASETRGQGEPDLLRAAAQPCGQRGACMLGSSAPDILRLKEQSKQDHVPEISAPPGDSSTTCSSWQTASGRRAHFSHSCQRLPRCKPPPGLSEGLFTPRPSPGFIMDPRLSPTLPPDPNPNPTLPLDPQSSITLPPDSWPSTEFINDPQHSPTLPPDPWPSTEFITDPQPSSTLPLDPQPSTGFITDSQPNPTLTIDPWASTEFIIDPRQGSPDEDNRPSTVESQATLPWFPVQGSEVGVESSDPQEPDTLSSVL